MHICVCACVCLRARICDSSQMLTNKLQPEGTAFVWNVEKLQRMINLYRWSKLKLRNKLFLQKKHLWTNFMEFDCWLS